MYTRYLALAALLFFVEPAAATQLLINGDIEMGDLTGWTTIGSALPSTNEQAADYSSAPDGPLVPIFSGGTYGAKIRTGSSIDPVERGFSQLVGVTPGELLAYSLDFALREVQFDFGEATVLSLRLDGITVDQITQDVPYPTPFFGSFSGTFTPTGSQVLWEMVVDRPRNLGTGHGQVFFDNALLDNEALAPAIPEPSAALVFCVGLIVAARRVRGLPL